MIWTNTILRTSYHSSFGLAKTSIIEFPVHKKYSLVSIYLLPYDDFEGEFVFNTNEQACMVVNFIKKSEISISKNFVEKKILDQCWFLHFFRKP